jgi:hypothetical protein
MTSSARSGSRAANIPQACNPLGLQPHSWREEGPNASHEHCRRHDSDPGLGQVSGRGAGHAARRARRLRALQSVGRHLGGQKHEGMVETLRYQVIAGARSCSRRPSKRIPANRWPTAFHMDGDRLMLTHYCVAKNQPASRATSFEDGGRTVVFTFVDGGNIRPATRAHGQGDLPLRGSGSDDVPLDVVSGRQRKVDGGNRPDAAPETNP